LSELKIVEAGNLMTPQQAAQYLQVKLSTIYQMSMKRILPTAKIGRLNRYRKSDLDKFIADNLRGAIDERDISFG